MRSVLLLCLVCLMLTSCGQRVDTNDARRLVKRYNTVVSEAYRRADIKLIDSVVSDNEGKKLTGLIGVRLDMGLTMDASLLELEMISVEQDDKSLRVRTKEQWYYRDLKIGTGEQVGPDSYDSYEMMYFFVHDNDKWLVDKIEFAGPPQVGREVQPWTSDVRTLHNMAGSTNKSGE